MPLYTAITQEGTVSGETKAKIAEEITRIHTCVMKVPKNFVRVIFLSYPKGSGFAGGCEVPTAALNCVLRSGHTVEEKADICANRTCEVGMEHATRAPYESFVYALEKLTRT
jgi:phenylpyruvate tautomerase PptA (4-oxalocrotonate tautomerase family)